MRVLLTVPSLDREFGGPTGKARGLAAALRSLGHDVRLVGAGETDQPGTIGLGQRGSFHATPVPETLVPLRRLLRDADVVHVIGYRDPVGTVAALVARRQGVPYALEPVGMLQPRLRSFALKSAFDATVGRALAGGAGVFVVASTVEMEDLVRAGVPADRIRARPNGVDFSGLLPLPARGPFRIRLGIPTEAPLVVTLARIAAIKGLTDLARALGSLPDLWWLLAGPDEGDGTLGEVRGLLDRAGASGRAVILSDGVWGEDRRAALAEADVFCLPSEYESFGTAVVEAAGVGVPVVFTENCGAKDMLNARVAQVVPVGVPDRLAAAVTESLTTSADKAAAVEAPALRKRLEWSALARAQVNIYGSMSSPG